MMSMSGSRASRWVLTVTGMAPIMISTEIDIRADLVGDTGIEPVTSSV
jgi:hypothetical protein